MSFRPNRYGPNCPTGLLTVAVAGTAIPLSTNWSPADDPNAPVTAAAPGQYALSFEDVIINSPPTNSGGLYIVQYNIASGNGVVLDPNTILLYIPKGSIPISMKKFLGGSRFNPNSLGLDADQNGDGAWISGIVGS